MPKRIRLSLIKKIIRLFGFILFVLFFIARPSVFADTPAQYIENGENELFSETVDGVLQAYSIFQYAKSDYPNDPVINTYLAVTRILNLLLTQDPEGATDLLSKYGIIRTGSYLDTLDLVPPLNNNDKVALPETAPSSEYLRSFLCGAFLTALNDSLSNLDTTITQWTDSDKHVVAKEKLGTDKDIEFDYGDIYLFRAGLKAFKCLVSMISAYNLDIDVRELVALFNLEVFDPNILLTRYPDLLNLLQSGGSPSYDGAGSLADAKSALLGAISDYFTSSEKIRNDNNTESGADELIEIDQDDAEEALFRENLGKMQTSLIGGTNAADLILERTGTEYHVYGGDTFTTDEPSWWEKGYYPEEYGYVYLGSANRTATFNGDYAIYIIMTCEGNKAPVDTVQGSDGSFFGTDTTANTLFWWNVGQPPDFNYALVGGERDGERGFIVIRPTTTNFLKVYLHNCEAIEEDEHFLLDLNPLFNNNPNLRDMLPQFNECVSVDGTIGHGLGDDPTLGGILPGRTHDDWDILLLGQCIPVRGLPWLKLLLLDP